MRVATIRKDGRTQAVRLHGETAVLLPFADVVELLNAGEDWEQRAATTDGPALDTSSLDFAPVVPAPEKIVCVGLNYDEHAQEAGRKVAEHPVLFAKYSRSLIGAHDPIILPAASDSVDWEVELGVVIGREARHIAPSAVSEVIAGYTIVNDVSMRDWQFRTSEFLQGKTFESSTPVGPYLATLDEFADPAQLSLSSSIDGETMQSSNTRQMIFSVAEIISYVSTIITLVPGDLIATGTPSGVGVARKPPVFLKPGNEMRCVVEGLGEQRNLCVADSATTAEAPRAAEVTR